MENSRYGDFCRGSRILKVIDRFLAVEAAHAGLSFDEVSEIVGGGRRTVYRWIRGMVESGRYEWKGNRKEKRLRRPGIVGTQAAELKWRDDWEGKGAPLGKGVRW